MPPSQLLASGNNGVIDTLSANPFLLHCFLSVSFLFLLLSLPSPCLCLSFFFFSMSFPLLILKLCTLLPLL